MNIRAIIDYETRSKINLKKSGAIVYAKDVSTSIFCVGYKINDGPSKLWIPERAAMPDDLWQAFLHGDLVAHNAAFERAITAYTLTRYPLLTKEQREFLSAIPISSWHCLAAKAAMAALPRALEGAAKALSLPVLKDDKGSKLIKKYSKPRKPSKHNPSLWWSDKDDLRGIYRYCLTDIDVEYLVDQALPDLIDAEKKIWALDQKINDRGILVDIPLVKNILALATEETKHITKRVQELSGGEVEGPNKVAKMLLWVNARGANLANLQAATIRDRLEADDLDDDVRKMLILRQSGSKTSIKKYISMLHAVGSDHRARELLLYAGAIPTARWSGKRIQPQNFPRPTIKDLNHEEAASLIRTGDLSLIKKRYGKTKVMDLLSSFTRCVLIASPGKELYCADFAAIEARIAFWVANHTEGVKAFREGRKLYEEMAAEAFGCDIEWLLTKEGKESLERFVGKESVLGCQYGLGWAKFLKNCHQKGVKQVTPEMAKRAVNTYRKVHHPIPTFWASIERAAVQALRHPGKRYTVTKVSVYVSGDWLCIKLPSGRRLRYFKPRLSSKQLSNGTVVPEIRYWTVDGYTRKWVEVSIWGGVFTNHIVQGISRDLMANAMGNIEGADYQMLISVHDEALAERDKGTGSVKEFVRLMTKLPAWAKGAPVTAEGWTGARYRK